MKSASGTVSLAILAMVAVSCGRQTPAFSTPGGCPVANTSCSSVSGSMPPPDSSSGTLPVYVADPGTTGQWGYPNEPLVSITVCSPNHTSNSQCQTVSNVLVDTGSFGLRIFGSALQNVQLKQQTVNVAGRSMDLAECALFGSGTDWGAVKNADVQVGNQQATNIPIQVIDVSYGSIPSICSDLCPDTDPCTSGFNGILGVGPFVQDCGSTCSSSGDSRSNPGVYFACDDSGCFNFYGGNCGGDGQCAVQVPMADQVGNPIAFFASGYNNGLALSLPGIDSSGSSSITGSMTLGVGSPQSVSVYSADPNGMNDGKGLDFSTEYDGISYGSSSSSGSVAFLDSGSNGIFFPGSFTICAEGAGFFCPSSDQSLNATIAGYDGRSPGSAPFSIGNATSLFGSGKSAFDNVGGPANGMFDWGLPFFYGKTVYIGIAGTTAQINSASETGPYWAF